MYLLKFLIPHLVFSLVITTPAFAQLIYGDFCVKNATNPTAQCNPSLGLDCRGSTEIGTCQCAFPYDMTYVEQTGACQAKLNVSCIHMGYTLNCLAGTCNDDTNICECSPDRVPSQNRDICFPSYGAPCNDNIDEESCSPYDHLRCLSGVCRCWFPLEEYWDSTQKICTSFVGMRCDPGAPNGCDKERGVCTVDDNSDTGFSCQCDKAKGFSPDISGKCSKTHIAECNATTPCAQGVGLDCYFGRCRCQFDQASVGNDYWSEKKQACVSKEGYKCGIVEGLPSSYIPCEDGFECVSSFGYPHLSSGICRRSTSGGSISKSNRSAAAGSFKTNFLLLVAIFSLFKVLH